MPRLVLKKQQECDLTLSKYREYSYDLIVTKCRDELQLGPHYEQIQTGNIVTTSLSYDLTMSKYRQETQLCPHDEEIQR